MREASARSANRGDVGQLHTQLVDGVAAALLNGPRGSLLLEPLLNCLVPLRFGSLCERVSDALELPTSERPACRFVLGNEVCKQARLFLLLLQLPRLFLKVNALRGQA
jgi:hypothetical protein